MIPEANMSDMFMEAKNNCTDSPHIILMVDNQKKDKKKVYYINCMKFPQIEPVEDGVEL